MQGKRKKVLITAGILAVGVIMTAGCRNQKKTDVDDTKSLPQIVVGCD